MLNNQRVILKRSGLISPPSAEDVAASMPRIDGAAAMEGKPFLVPLALIKPSPHQTSPINEQKVTELVSNLEKNPLSSPVVLRRDGAGGLELIAGRHRIEAYRHLGRTEIEAVLRNLSEDEAEKLVFYDNLFAPSMADFQKYLGFSQRKERKGLTQAALAEESGMDPAAISRLMAFDGLPDKVRATLIDAPEAIGSNMAVEFVELAKKMPDLAVDAVTAIAVGEMTRKAAMAWLRDGGKVAEKPAKPAPVKALIKSGRRKYAELTQRENRLVIDMNEADPRLYDELQAWLKSRAAQHFNTQAQEGERAAD